MTLMKVIKLKLKNLLNKIAGSITCIICFTCVGSQLSINSSSARSFSGPVQLCDQHVNWMKVQTNKKHYSLESQTSHKIVFFCDH
uniref:Uncharacterized protein n=1 Tax=Oryzias latipes TaxID=8090 RepID=A0A3P9JHV3_ORYLA